VTLDQGKYFWVIRAGKNGEAHDIFLKKSLIVLSDPGLGDLEKLPAKRESFYKAYGNIRPEETRTGITGIGGKFFRFVHEVKVGDQIIYPSLIDKLIYVGAVKSKYKYDIKMSSNFTHKRQVKWEYYFPKRLLSEYARRELNAARTFFQLKKNYDEIRKTFADKKKAVFLG
jgi:predicted Mrr-cat superfamily restriction endonuclease